MDHDDRESEPTSDEPIEEADHPSEAQRAVRAICLGAALGAILALLARGRSRD